MTDMPAVRRLLTAAPAMTHDRVILSYDARMMRRKRLETEHGGGFMVDLAEVTNLDDYWGFELMDGRAIQIVHAEEEVMIVTGPDIGRYAWHIGNRHTPCQIDSARLVIRADHVLEHMLLGLGAVVTRTIEPFTPEKGAYGMGRTMGHEHGPATLFASSHSHAHPHTHSHD